ncbi:MAG TPA: hypothetical protein VNU19_24165, partial [Candidatus Acidoferrum sp.]|nr:hypothetical protein [Candidatus Acidoferrum sp.]
SERVGVVAVLANLRQLFALASPWQKVLAILVVIVILASIFVAAASGGKATLAPVVSYTLRGLAVAGVVAVSGFFAIRNRRR